MDSKSVGWALRPFSSLTPASLAAQCPRVPSAWAKSRDSGAHLHQLDRRFCPPYASRRRLSLRLRQLEVDIRAVDDDVFDEDARLDLVALEEGGEHVDAEPAPFHRVELDRHRQVLLLDRAQRRRHAV